VEKEKDSLSLFPVSYECPYGFAWFIKFFCFLFKNQDSNDRYRIWYENFTPLFQEIERRLLIWCNYSVNIDAIASPSSDIFPNRCGWHYNTSFALKMILEEVYPFDKKEITCFSSSFREILLQILSKLFLHGKDVKDDLNENCPFLSPSLCEADLMTYYFELLRRMNSQEEHQKDNDMTSWNWLLKGIDNSTWLLSPNLCGDPKDGYKSHLCGLNLSRSYCLLSIVSSLLSNPFLLKKFEENETIKEINIKKYVEKITESAILHYNSSIPVLGSGYFMGDHWLTSFAIRAFFASINLNNLLKDGTNLKKL
jgi:hypothetical protein